MKRYLLFAGVEYYPCGGWDDFVSSFDTLEEAKIEYNKNLRDWAHVVDITTGDRYGNYIVGSSSTIPTQNYFCDYA